MPALANLVLKNQAAADVTFAPVNIQSATGVANWMGAGATLDNRTHVSSSVTLPTGKATKVRGKQKVTVPVLDPVTGVKVDEIIINIDFAIPRVAVLADRQNARAYAASLLTNAITVAMVENYESVY